MSVHFTKVKLCWPCRLEAIQHSDFGRFQPTGGRFWGFDSCRTQIGQSFQVPTNAFELQFQPVGFAPHIAHPPITCAPLPPSKNGFNFTPDRTEQPVCPHRRRTQLLSAAGLAQNPVSHTVLTAPFAPGLAPIRLVSHDHFLVALDYVFKFLAVMHVGRRQRHLPDQRVGFIHGDMRLVTVMGLAFFHRVTRVAIAAGLIALRRCAAGRLQQRRIHQRAGFQNQALGLQLPVDHRQQVFVQAVFAQPLAEAHQCRFIRHGVLQTQTDKAPPTQAVADHLLTLRIGQTIAVLEQTHLEKHQRRTGRAPSGRRIHRLQCFLQGLPIQGPIQPFQKIIRRRGDHQAVQKSKLGVGRCLHTSRTLHSITKFQDFCRDPHISVGQLGNKSFLYLPVAPGEHHVWNSFARIWGTTFTAEAGKNYFFAERHPVLLGGVPKIKPITEGEGKAYAEQFTLSNLCGPGWAEKYAATQGGQASFFYGNILPAMPVNPGVYASPPTIRFWAPSGGVGVIQAGLMNNMGRGR